MSNETPQQPPREQPGNQYTQQPPFEQRYQQPPQGHPQYGQPQQFGPVPQNPAFGQPQQFGQQPQYAQQPPIGQPQYGQPPYGQPPVYTQPQPQKRSLRWLWITLGVVGGLLVLGCAACGILGALGVNLFAQAAQPAVVAGQYYGAVSQQDYTKAYSYLDTSSVSVQGQTLTPQAYTQAAQVLDTTQGKVTKASPTSYNVTNDTATVTMAVTRGSATYDAHLQLKKIGNDWKIVSVDKL